MMNRCNGTCSFCPANSKTNIRKALLMSEELLDKIIHDLHQMNYKGQICLSVNNEPLLDPDFLARLKRIRSSFPDNRIIYYTNGTLMTEEIMLSSIELTDDICIDNYYDDKECIKSNLKIIIKKIGRGY